MNNDDYDWLLILLMTFSFIYVSKGYDQFLPCYHLISTGQKFISA